MDDSVDNPLVVPEESMKLDDMTECV